MLRLEFMEIPRFILFGPKAMSHVPRICRNLTKSRKIFVLTGGKKTTRIANERILPYLLEEGYEVNTYALGEGGVSFEKITNVYRMFKTRRSSLILAVGGGKVIDAAKVLSALTNTNYVSVPTSAANDGIASPAISYLLKLEIHNKLRRRKIRIHAPVAIIADTEVISMAPKKTLASGCGDLIAKFVAVKDWELAHKLRGENYSEYAASMALMSAELVVRRAKFIKEGLEESARIVVKALIGSGVAMSIAGSSRPASGSEHLFSHALDLLSKKYGFKPAPHGLQCGVGAIMMMWLHGGDWEMIRDTLREVGAATNAYELGIDPKYIVEALTIAHKIRPERYTILGEVGLTREAAERMAKETGVI